MMNKKGFTLIEMIVTIALILLLTTVFTSSLVSYIGHAQNVSTGVESHQTKYDAAKASVNALGNGGVVSPGAASPAALVKVTFDPVGGSAIPFINVAVGSTVSNPGSPTKAGFAFGGWYADASYSTIWNFATDTVASDMTLYAKWDPIAADTYSVVFNYKTAAGVDTQFIESNIPSGGSATPPAVTGYAGYTFSTWNGTYTNITGNQTVSAVYIPIAAATYSVTFNYKTAAGVDTQAIESNIPSGGSATPPVTTGYTGYTFSNWSGTYTNVTSNQTVTAVYTPIAVVKYSVTFNYKTAAGVATQAVVSNIVSGGSATPPATTGYTGYTFSYWNGTYTNVTSNQTVNAVYIPTATKYTVTFNYKSSTGAAAQAVVSNIPSGGSATPPTTTGYTGYVFSSWSGVYTNVTSNQTVTAVYSPVSIAATLAVGNSWGSGPYTQSYEFSLKNTTAAKTSTWTIKITVPLGTTIASSWNGTYSISGTTLTITPASHNAGIDAGKTITNIGFQLSTPSAFVASSPVVTSS